MDIIFGRHYQPTHMVFTNLTKFSLNLLQGNLKYSELNQQNLESPREPLRMWQSHRGKLRYRDFSKGNLGSSEISRSYKRSSLS